MSHTSLILFSVSFGFLVLTIFLVGNRFGRCVNEKQKKDIKEWGLFDNFTVFCYLIVLPIVLNFLVWTNTGFPMDNSISIGDYKYHSLFYDAKEKDVKVLMREENGKLRFYSLSTKSFKDSPIDDVDGGTISVLEKNDELVIIQRP